jgi:hypothetical protein
VTRKSRASTKSQLIVATENYQVEYLDKLSTQTAHPSLSTGGESSPYVSNSQIPTYFLGRDETRELEPDLSPDIVGALLVTSTGIVDSQGLVDSLAREIEEEDYVGEAAVGYGKAKGVQRGEGVVVRGTRVVRIDREEKGRGWVVQLESNWEGKSEGEKGDVESVRADVVVNAAGLGSATLLEGIVPESEAYNIYPVKGPPFVTERPFSADDRQLHVVQRSRSLECLPTHLPLPFARSRLPRHAPHPRLERERQVRTGHGEYRRRKVVSREPRLLAGPPRAVVRPLGLYRRVGTIVPPWNRCEPARAGLLGDQTEYPPTWQRLLRFLDQAFAGPFGTDRNGRFCQSRLDERPGRWGVCERQGPERGVEGEGECGGFG